MIKVYIEKRNAPELTPSLVFWPNFRFEISPKLLFRREIMSQYQKPFFEIVSDVSAADFVAAPYEYYELLRYAPEYLERVYAIAKSARKKALLFDYSDYVDRAPKIPAHAVIFRISTYRHHQRANEIIMPYFVEDMGARGITPKEKGEPLVVGYCGQSKFGSVAKKWRATAKRIFQLSRLSLAGDQNPLVHERGIFLRSRALAILRKSAVATSFVERAFYSLHRAAMPYDPNEVRQEYIENLRTCDLSLCARGDANASQRFYEAFSASRIPLFIDTDCVLPLEGIIPYDDVMIRVPSSEIGTIPARVRAWSGAQTPESFIAREKRAREIYEKFLRLDRYFEIVFDREKGPHKEVLYKT